LLKTKKVYVGKFVSKKDRMRQLESSWTNVYVKDIDKDVSDDDFCKSFGRYGNITSAVIMRNHDGISKGFGFVNFDQHDQAVAAVAALHQSVIGDTDKRIWCCRHQKKAERKAELDRKYLQIRREQISKYQGTNLFIKNLEDDIKEDRLKKEFSVFGTIRSVKIMIDEKGNSKGFGFVCFQTPEEASHGINDMNGRTLQGCHKPLYVAIHEPKEIRRQKLNQRYAHHRSKPMRQLSLPVGPPGPAVYPPPYVYNHAGSPPFIIPQQPLVPRPPASRGPWTGQPQQYPIPPSGPSLGYNQSNRGGRGPRPTGSGVGGRGGNRPGNNRRHQAGESLQQLMQYPPEQQKLLLGERLYPLIHEYEPELAGKITGMLLDSGWQIEELYSLLENDDKLKQKIEEARDVLSRASPAEYRKETQDE